MSDEKPNPNVKDVDLNAKRDTPNARALDALVGEAKEHLAPAESDLDWSRLEAKMMAAIEKEPAAAAADNVHDFATARRRSAIRVGTLVLAAAASVFLILRNDDSTTKHETTSTSKVSTNENANAAASDLRATEGNGAVRINKVVANAGLVVRANDTLEVDRGARAVLERPDKVNWLIEQDAANAGAGGAVARVKSAGESLILGLENGAIEAQVTPVPQGEAFAVDVATEHGLVRVAVHGTHLRVARAGNRVVVDLTEGVVSIGNPPRTGITIGTLVTAPAHVELDATDLKTLRIDHDVASVRAAIPLGPSKTTLNAPPSLLNAPEQATPIPAAAPTQLVAATSAPKTPSLSPTDQHAGAVIPPAQPPKQVETSGPPREAIAAAVKQCAATHGRTGAAESVHVTVSSTLRLHISESGEIKSAQFSPPLLPEIQSCAAKTIYKTKLEETGLVTIPIEFSY